MTQTNLTSKDIVAVATRVIDIIEAHGLPCYLFGSTACLLHGSMRTPNVCSYSQSGPRSYNRLVYQDVDIVVNTEAYDPNTLKSMVADGDPAVFELHVAHAQEDGGTPRHILWGVLDRKQRCKIDILVPGFLDIPSIPVSSVVTLHNLPVMPLLPLLLMKLRGWDKHLNSPRQDHQKKQYVDAWDVYQLLRLAVSQGVNAADTQNLPEDVEGVAQIRSANFVARYPAQMELWRKLGLAVKPPSN